MTLYPDSPDRDRLLATAAELRERGDRPSPPSLKRPEPTADATPMSPDEAAIAAVSLMRGHTGTDQHAYGMLTAPER